MKERQRQLFSYLLNSGRYVTTEELADAFGVSQRTVRNDLNAIEYEISPKQAVMERRPGVGVRITAEGGFEPGDPLQGPGIRDDSQEERAGRILLYLALCGQATIDELAEYLMVSRNTAIADIRRAQKLAEKEHVRLKGEGYVGTSLSGGETEIRRLLYNMHIRWMKASEDGLLPFAYELSSVTRNEITDLIAFLEQTLDVTFADRSIREMEGGLLVAMHRMQAGRPGREAEVQESSLRTGLRRYFRAVRDMELSRQDLDYLEMVFESARYLSGAEGTGKGGRIAGLCREVLKDFSELVRIEVKETGEIEEKFLVHLQIAVTRLKNNIRIENDLLAEIKYSASFMFEIAKKLLRRHEEAFGVVFPEEEIAFAAMYFEVLFLQQARTQEDLRIVIVCHGGVATSSLLKQRLAVILPQLRIFEILRVGNLNRELERIHPDLVITTLSLKIPDQRVVRVNPILNPEDVRKITDAVSDLTYIRQNDLLLNRVDWGQIRPFSLLLQPGLCRFDAEETDWKAAIRKAAQPLLQGDWIEEAYINEMIRVVQEMGNYMVFIPEIAFVHAKPNHVNRTGIAVLNLRNRIDFGSRTVTKVKTIVVVANHEENTLLAELIKLLLIGDNVEIFKNAAGYDDYWKMKEG